MRIFAVLIATLSIAMASSSEAQMKNPEIEFVHQPCDSKTSARVFVTADGVVSLNGRVLAVELLSSSLQKLMPGIQTVCYSRANPEAFEPHPIALKALDAITQFRLPIAFYWDTEFQQRVHFKQ